ncbi:MULTISPECIES: hypothetical protein [unclassified Polynucleobacter]|nr:MULTISPECIES: hypothetical protein [unclassified Polynucleobacter]
MYSVQSVKYVSGTDLTVLVCPARFERATLGLNGVKISMKQYTAID